MRTRLVLLAAAALAAAGCFQPAEQKFLTQCGSLVAYPLDFEGIPDDCTAALDFGPVAPGQTRTRKLVLHNNGAQTLTLGSPQWLSGGMGQTGPAFELQLPVGITLAPQQTVVAEARFHAPPADTEGPVEARVLLGSQAASGPPLYTLLTLEGRAVASDCGALPALDFGNVVIGAEARLELNLVNPTREPAEVTLGGFTSAKGDHLAFTLGDGAELGTFTLAPGEGRAVAVVFAPAEAKDFEAFLEVRPSALCPSQEVPLSGTGVGEGLTWPNEVDCGYVNPGTTVTTTFTFENALARPVALTGMRVLNPGEFGFKVPGDNPTRLTVPAATREDGGGWIRGTAEVEISCRGTVAGPRYSRLNFSTDLPHQPSGSVNLELTGGGPDIQVSPSPVVAFGKVAWFPSSPSSQTLRVTVVNVGVPPPVPDIEGNLRLTDAEGDGFNPVVEIAPLNEASSAAELTATLSPTYPLSGLVASAGRNSTFIDVALSPASAGLKKWSLKIYSNDPDEPVTTLTVAAEVVEVPPCRYRLVPPALGFGVVGQGQVKELEFAIENLGTQAAEICLVGGIRLREGTSPAFSLPAAPPGSFVLGPGESKAVVVRFAPLGAPNGHTFLTGAVELYLSSPLTPQPSVLLGGTFGPACLALSPSAHDFGALKTGCPSPFKTFSVTYVCSSTLTVNGITMLQPAGQPAGGPNCPGTAPCPEFVVAQWPPLPVVLSPASAPLTFTAQYKPLDTGVDRGQVGISVTQSGRNLTYLLPVKGEGGPQAVRTQTFGPLVQPQLDFPLDVLPDLSAGPIKVEVDGVMRAPVDVNGLTVWTYDQGSNAVVFSPGHEPQPGQTVTLSYRPDC